MNSKAASHFLTAFQAIYRENSSPFLVRLPSGGLCFSTGEPHPLGNFVTGASAGELTTALEKLRSVGAPAAILAPGERNLALESNAAEFDFVHAGALPAMSASLERLPSTDLPPGYTFERLRSNDQGAEWARALADGYPITPLAAESFSPIHVPLGDTADADIQFFQITYDGSVAGTSAMVLADGVAGIYCVATLPDHRRKGLGAALTARPLALARELGYSIGVLQSSEAGYKVYQRLGFVDDGAVQMYLRLPPEDS